MKYRRILISGGPSSGKTTLINSLEKEGYFCFHEISRELIKESKKEGVDQPFLTAPKQFNEKLIEGRLLQFNEAEKITRDVFYDRGLHDVVAYMLYADQIIPKRFNEICLNNKYDLVFLLPPWEKIHIQDKERYETFEQATDVYNCLYKVYKKYGYKIIKMPKGTIQERKRFILDFI